ncbi:MAG TPA: hypothetical protein VI457_10225 [Methylococcaceae bacterium]|nr:hypothetical protein [Methylococcaceae bacterium]
MFDKSFTHNNRRRLARAGLILPVALASALAAAASDTEMTQTVKIQPCKGGETVAQYLDHKLSSSFRDLGWRMFPANDGFDVERAFLASKFMELRYRWRVDRSGQVRAISERAQNLCS